VFHFCDSWAGQPFELKRHIYYKIEEAGKLVGYAEEYLKPVREIPNLEVEISFKTFIGSRLLANTRLVREEVYYVDLTHDKLLKGWLTSQDEDRNLSFRLDFDFQHFKYQKKSPLNANTSAPVLMSRNTILGYHRFLTLYFERGLPDSSYSGTASIIRTDIGEIADLNWRLLPDTSLTVDGFRLLCNHFIIADPHHHPLQELWTLKNSGRLVRGFDFKTNYTIELADVTFRNIFEAQFELAVRKPRLLKLNAQVFGQNNGTGERIASKMFDQPMDTVHYPLSRELLRKLEEYLAPIETKSRFDADTLFQIGASFSHSKFYLDEVLMTFARWSNQTAGLKPTLEKDINSWNSEDYQHFAETLALFSNLCRNSNLPTRFVRGFYCLSVVDNLCYNWIWIEVSDGKTWYPWHLESLHAPHGGAEFVRVLPVDWDYVRKFKFTPLKNVVIDDYEFNLAKKLF
jgi:hypothetical protein